MYRSRLKNLFYGFWLRRSCAFRRPLAVCGIKRVRGLRHTPYLRPIRTIRRVCRPEATHAFPAAQRIRAVPASPKPRAWLCHTPYIAAGYVGWVLTHHNHTNPAASRRRWVETHSTESRKTQRPSEKPANRFFRRPLCRFADRRNQPSISASTKARALKGRRSSMPSPTPM